MSINAQPFNPTFKLIGNLEADQVLTYDVSENAFVNSTGSGGTSVTGFTAAVSQGATGESIFDTAGATLQFKSLIGGTDITITDNGTALVINSTLTETFQTGTNLGTGLGIYDSKDATTHQLKFKSLAVGAGLTINDDGAGTLTLVNTVSGGGAAGADTTLSNLADVATARTNLGVLSTIQGDIKYLRTDASTIPQSNNTYDIGSSVSKYNDVYAETFHGTAVLADQLTISASSGQVLTHNGSEWVAGAGSSVLSSASDMSNVAPADGQHLVWDTGTSLWTPGSAGTGGGGYQDSDARASISVAGDLSYNSSTGVITFSQNDAWSNITGTPTTLAGYGITDGGGSVTASSTDTFTNKSGAISQWTNDSNYLTTVPAQTFASLTSKPTTLAGYGITDGGGSYANSNVDGHLSVSGATANQALVWTGTDYDWVTSTDSDTTYTAGSGLTLAGTVFSNTSPDQTVVLTGTGATSITGTYPNFTINSTDTNTDTDTTYTAGSGLTLTGTAFSLSAAHFDGAYASLTGAPTMYANSNVDGHLNVSGASANQILKWTGTDYAWVTSTDSDTTYTAGSGLTLTGTSFSLTAGHFDGAYGSLTGAPTTVSSFTNDAGYLTAQTDSQTLSLYGSVLTISTGNNVDLGVLTLDDFADVAISSVSDGQFLTYDNGAGDWTNSTVSIPTLTSQLTNDAGFITSASTYDNSDVDTHLNQSNPTSGYVLSWNGSDYSWVANAGGGGIALTDLSATTGLSYNNGTGVFSLNAELKNLSNVASTAPSTGQVLKWNGTTWTPGTDENDDTIYTSFNSDFDTRLAAKSTTNISEGTNKYFTDARTRNAISVSGDLSYNASTGVISYSESAHYDNDDVDTHINQASATSGQILSWDGSDYDWIANSGTPAWSAVTGKPTTIAGFGITDAFNGTFGALTGTPTTLAGYGITDSLTASSSATLTNKSGNNSQWTNDAGYLTSVPAQSFASLTSKPTNLTGYGITDAATAAQGAKADTALQSVPAQSFASLTGKPTTIAGYGITDRYANAEVDGHLNVSGASNNEVLSWTGTDYAWVSNAGGGSTDKITEGNSSVEVIDGGANGHIMFETENTDRWRIANTGHILPEANATYDIGSASNKVRHLYLSDTSLYIGSDTLRTNSSNLLFNGDDVQDYDNLKNTPSTISAGTGIQVSSGVVSLNSTLSGLTDVHTATPTEGQVLKWDNGNSRWTPAADLTSGSAAMDDLTDVSTSGITSGQYLSWNGSSFVATTPSGGGASAIDNLSDVDTTTSAPSNGDVLTWNTSDSEWAPAAPSGGGSGATIEMFKLNYATNGNLDTVTNTTSGVSATITSATGGTVDITFGSTNYPPANMLCYGYAYASNKYVVKPVSGDMSTKEVTGGGSTGSPIAFGSMSSVKLTLKLREADTGAGRSFGTVTHAWIMFTTV